MTFYQELEFLCRIKGISVSKLCKEIGLSNATATQWKKGAIPNAKNVKLIANYLEVDEQGLARHAAQNCTMSPEVLEQTRKMAKYHAQKGNLLLAYEHAPKNIQKAINLLLEIDIEL